MIRRPRPSDQASDEQSRLDPTGGHDRRPAHAAHGRATQRSLPWGAVVAGAGAVTLVVAAAGMVGAATGGPPAVVVPGATSGGVHGGEPGSPVVIPRADEPRPTVTRIPPRADGDGATPQEGRGRDTAPSTPSVEPSPGDVVAEPAPEQSADPTAEQPGTGPARTPAPTTSPTREPTPTAEPGGAADARWVQQRLRAHGATVKVTGELDEATVTALKAFQASAGLPAGGTVDAATREALAAEPEPGDGASGGGGGTPTEDPAPGPTGTPPATLAPPGAGLSATTPSGAPAPAQSSPAG